MTREAKVKEWLDILRSEIEEIASGNNTEVVSREELTRILKVIHSSLEVVAEFAGGSK